MRCFVTGASGFIGASLVHALVEQGHEVRALLRPFCDRRGLEGAAYEAVTGDLSDRAALEAGMRGCDWCFHVAASYHLWLRDYRTMYQTNVDGTRLVLESAAKTGCSRIVYTSTAGCIGLARDGQGRIVPADERSPLPAGLLCNHYKRSKWRAEQIALQHAAQGLPVVIVNPTAPIGPRDFKPTPTGRFIVDFLDRRIPAYLDTGLNWVHVRDVAVGHILAAERGRIGERYILGHAEGNWSLKKTLEVLAELTGLPAPRRRVPYTAALGLAYLSEGLSRLTGRPPRAPLAGVRMAKHRMFFDPTKAILELRLPQTPVQEAFALSVEGLRRHTPGRDG